MNSPRTFLIAGGRSGIGAATVAALDEAGHHVVCAARQPQAATGSDRVRSVTFDATASEAELDLPDSLDGLVYCPGTIRLKPFHRLGDEEFMEDLQVNLLGAVRLIRAALPALKNSNSDSPGIVMFSTVAVQTGMPFHASIAAAKGAVEGLVRSLAAELAPRIRVNALAPSLTDTPLSERLIDSDEKRAAAGERHPLKQIGQPEDLAAAVTFLLSEQAKFVTGQVIAIDGGLSSIRLL